VSPSELDPGEFPPVPCRRKRSLQPFGPLLGLAPPAFCHCFPRALHCCFLSPVRVTVARALPSRRCCFCFKTVAGCLLSRCLVVSSAVCQTSSYAPTSRRLSPPHPTFLPPDHPTRRPPPCLPTGEQPSLLRSPSRRSAPTRRTKSGMSSFVHCVPHPFAWP
jgi:hypothetical protein